MKIIQIYIFLIIFSFGTISLHSQIKFGIRAGLNTTEVNPNSLLITNRDDIDDFRLNLENARYGYHLGLFIQANSEFLFIQPEIWFRSNSAEFMVEDIQAGVGNEIFTERYQYIDIPVQLGIRLGPVRMGCGPVGHLFINSVTEFEENTQVQDYEKRFEDITLGYVAGLGIDIWNFHLDLTYEGNFSKFGDHFSFYGRQYAFDSSPARLIGTVGISF
jgi:hypothetical protein